MPRAPVKKPKKDKLSMRMKVGNFWRNQKTNFISAWERIKNPRSASHCVQIVPVDHPVPELNRTQMSTLYECCTRLVRLVEKDKKKQLN